ncbi:MAG: hypothetical protein HZB65_00195 [Candidatus Aenigmarchaeota archaeon]|nr:hypothetical protein [Candidatus Aenigmarchaeota archaeon]
MGIECEYNPDLALRNFSEVENGNREEAECLPNKIEAGKCYEFLKKDREFTGFMERFHHWRQKAINSFPSQLQA